MRAATVVLLPILLGLALRLLGLQHGDGKYIYHPDVSKQLWVAALTYSGANHGRDVFKRDFELAMYPYGTATMLGRAASWAGWAKGQNLRNRSLWQWGLGLRLVSVTMGMGALLVLMLALRRAYGDGPILLTGLMLTVEPLHAQLSHYGMNDVPMVSLLLLAWLAAVAADRDQRGLGIYSLAAGFALGLAFGVKYQALLGGIFLAGAWLAHGRRLGWGWFFRSAASAALGGVAGLAVSCPMLFIDPVYFFQWFPKFMSWQADITGLNLTTWEKLENNVPRLLMASFDQLRWLLLAPAAWTILRLFRRDTPPTERCLTGTALAFCLALAGALVTSRDLVRPNDLLPLLPFLILAAGWAVARIVASWGNRAALTACAVFMAASFVTTLLDSLALTRTDTRVLARNWCDANIPDKSIVRREPYTFRLGKRVVDREHRYLSLPEVRLVIENGRFDFLITSSMAHSRFFNPHFHGESESAQTFYRQLPERFTEVARFSDRKMMFAHPTITIYSKQPTPDS